MANNILEQFEELYSRWSVLNNIDKGMRLAQTWQQVSAVYNYLLQIYKTKGFLTFDEANYANQLQQMLLVLQAQKMRVDQELSEEMTKHLAKMIVKR